MIAAAAVIALVAVVLLQRNAPVIATITALDGTVRWTGDGGRVSHDLKPGMQVPGGTLECLSVDSSVAFRFLDGSTVTLSGLSKLTLSEPGRKELHLRAGHLSATVMPQREGRRLRVLTPAAELDVLGTRFDVKADDAQTKLTVSEGVVRATRRIDGRVVEVPAAHQAVATIDGQGDMEAVKIREAAHMWKANLERDAEHGKWLSTVHALRCDLGRAVESGKMTKEEAVQAFQKWSDVLREDEGVVRAMPYGLQPDPRRNVIWVVILGASKGQSGPIVLIDDNRFRIRGKVRGPAEIGFGFTGFDPESQSSMRYQMTRRIEGEFDVEIPLSEFLSIKDRSSATSARERDVVNWYCWTKRHETGLEITGVELLAPE